MLNIKPSRKKSTTNKILGAVPFETKILDDLITQAEFARRINRSRQYVYQLLIFHKLNTTKISNAYYIIMDDKAKSIIENMSKTK